MPVQIDARFPPKLELLFKPKRYKVLWGGRGAGRSWGVARALLIIGQSKPIRVLCAREFQNSIEESVHKVLSDQISKLELDAFYKIEKSKIYGGNGTTFSFEGIANNVTRIKSYEGIDYCWVEEANRVSRNSWSVLIPTIRTEGSEIWITFNPELRTDYTYQEFVQAYRAGTGGIVEAADATICKMNWKDNPWFPEALRAEMEKLKERDYDAYLNIWEGFPIEHLDGAIYAKELRRATEENRICTVPYDRETAVDTWWDLGWADKTVIWFTQQVGMQYRVLDYYENSMEDINHYLKVLQSKEYLYGYANLPHDAKPKRLGMAHSIFEVFLRNKYRTRISPSVSVSDGINATRLVFPNCYFDEVKCEDGINALRHYRYKTQSEHGKVELQLARQPLHDWASHGADAFRYFAIGCRRGSTEKATISDKMKRTVSKFVERAPGLGWMA